MSINVANNNPHVVYTVAEGATQTVFSITFEFFDDDEVQLYVDGIIKTQGSGDGKYTITGGEGSTGTATFNTVSSGTQPVTGATGGSQVVVTRNIPIERVTDFSAGSDINRAALNTQLDTLTAIAADNKMRSVRALTAPISDPTDVGTNLIIPKAADRANGFLSFDSSGNVAINSVVDLSFLTLERLDIDNVRIDGSTISSIDSGALTIGSELIVSGNLTVNGTTTTINSTTLTVDDKNIVLASGAATSLAADGAGITIDGASASLTYVNLTDAMTFNKDVDIGDNVIENAQKLHFTENVSLYPSDGDDSILNLQTDDSGAGQLRFITGTGAGAFRGGVVASTSNIFGLKDSNDQIFIKSQDGNLPTQILHTYDSPSAGNVVRIEAGSTYVKLYGSDGVEAQKYKDADDTSYYLEPAGTSVLATVGVTQLDVDNITIDGNTISSTDTDGNINLRCNGNGVVDVDSELFIYGNATNGTAAYVQIGNTDTGGDDIRIQGPNPNFTLYDSTAVADGVAAYTGGVNFYGQKTNTAYHQYSAIRPRIINGLDSDTAKTGALHFGVSDGASSALTNIIFKVEPTGADVTGNITVSGTVDGRDLQTDGSKLDAIEASATADQTAAEIRTLVESATDSNVFTDADHTKLNGIEASADVTDATNVAAAGAAMVSAANFTGDVTVKTSDGAELKLQTSDTTVNINNVLGKLSFNAPDEAGGTDAILEAASIKAVAASTFTSSSNATRLQFSTGNSEAAQIRMTIAPEGTVSVGSISTNAGYNDGTAIMSVGRGTDTFNILAINHSADADNVGQINFVGNTDANSAKIVHAPSAGMMQFYVGDAVGNRILNLHDDTSISAQNGFGVDSNGVIDGHGLTLGDNHKAIFGAGSDLQIWHNATAGASYIEDAGTGNLKIKTNGAGVEILNSADLQLAYFNNSSGEAVLKHINAGVSTTRLNTTSTGVDITGTLTADDITLSDASTPTITLTDTTNTLTTFLQSGNSTAVLGTSTAHDIRFQANSTDAIRIANGGDISFYEDTGTTAKFFWSAADERLGIGTSLPEGQLHLYSSSVGAPAADADDFVIEKTGDTGLSILSTTTGRIYFGDAASNDQGSIRYVHTDNSMRFETDSSERMRIDSSGVVNIKNAGSTADFISETATSFIVGDGSGTQAMTIYSGTANNGAIYFADGSTGNATYRGGVQYLHGSDAMRFYTAAAEAMRIDSSGNVGIGTDSPDSVGTGHPTLDLKGNSASQVDRSGAIYFTRYDGTKGMYIAHSDGANVFAGLSTYPMIFRTDNTERMRIDSSGNLLVGTTSDLTDANISAGITGIALRANKQLAVSRTGNTVAQFNRNTSDGDIVAFRKDGNTVGSISSRGGVATNLILRTATGQGAGIGGANSGVLPCDEDGLQDDEINLGANGTRWNDIYATNGTIQTSDRNEKQDIAELSDAEQRVAVAAKGLLRKFRWKDAVAEKGDEARTHFGIIAQDLQAAFTAEGLDAGDYAMFISSTWTDEETGEERTRMGVRYSELLAFIIAAI